MRYWKFDAVQLISDYKRNWRVIKGIDEELDFCDKLLENPIEPNTIGDWKAYRDILVIRRLEYQMYVNMVRRAFAELPEIEKGVLKDWLIERHDDVDTMAKYKIKNQRELEKIKEISLTRFVNIAMPN